MGTGRVRRSGPSPAQPAIPWLGDPGPCISSSSLRPLPTSKLLALKMKGQEKEDKEMPGVTQALALGKDACSYRRVPAPTPITHAFLTSKGFISELRRGWTKRKFQLSFPDQDES